MSSSSRKYPLRITVTVLIAIAFCLWGAFGSYNFEAAYQRLHFDPYLSLQFARFKALRAAVPKSAVLGYVSAEGPDGRMLSAQYVLAPRLLDRGASHDWVLGNFKNPANFSGIGESYGFAVQQDFGDGVVLFQRKH